MPVATEFHEVQRLRQWWVTLILLISLGITSAGLYQQVVLDRQWGTRPLSNGPFLLIEGGLLVFVLCPCVLETLVRDSELVIRYRGLWPARRIPLNDIRRANAIMYSPFSDYGGFGVRWGKDGSMICNATGDRGVEILLNHGKRIVVGSQRAVDLERAIARS